LVAFANRVRQIRVGGRKQLGESQRTLLIPGGHDLAVTLVGDRALVVRRRVGDELAIGGSKGLLVRGVERMTVVRIALEPAKKQDTRHGEWASRRATPANDARLESATSGNLLNETGIRPRTMDERKTSSRRAADTPNSGDRGLVRSERGREWALARHLLSPSRDDRVAALEQQLAAERERLVAIEQRLEDHTARIAALRSELDALRRRSERSTEEETRSPAATGLRLVELSDQCAVQGPAYWLRRCEGFQVEVGSEVIGTVEGVRFGHRHDRPDALVVSCGRWRRRQLLVSAEQVEDTFPDVELIRLSTDPRGRPPHSGHRDRVGPLVQSALRRLHRPWVHAA
jgi:hypothetical protein